MANPQHIKFLESIRNSQHFKMLNDFVNNPNTTINNAIDQIVNETIAAHTDPDKENFFTPGNIDYHLSLALMELVQLLEPSKHRKLVEFVCGLQKQVARDPSTGEPISLQRPSDVLWTRMPFGFIEREAWEECGGGYIGEILPCFCYLVNVSICRFANYGPTQTPKAQT
jgi:hypothetical protein